jgi:RNA polymerase sigma factor for flagellar operon FliA
MEISNFFGNASSSGNEDAGAVFPWDAFDAGKPWSDFTHAEQEQMARHFAPKVKYLALRLKARLPKNVELAELMSAGTLGLMEAFSKFKASVGVKFDTYAENRIRGAMLDELRRMDWLPRSLRQKVRVLDETIRALERQSGTRPTEEELARITGMETKDVRQGLEALQSQLCLSLDALQESLADGGPKTEGEPFSEVAAQELVERVAALIDQLTPREKLVLSLYYTDELNMREAAEVMGITEGRVSQLHSQALSRMRREFVNVYGEGSVS